MNILQTPFDTLQSPSGPTPIHTLKMPLDGLSTPSTLQCSFREVGSYLYEDDLTDFRDFPRKGSYPFSWVIASSGSSFPLELRLAMNHLPWILEPYLTWKSLFTIQEFIWTYPSWLSITIQTTNQLTRIITYKNYSCKLVNCNKFVEN